MSIREFLIEAGQVCGALAAAGALFGVLVKYFILTPIETRMDVRFSSIEYELKTNGGGSLRDEVRGIRQVVDKSYAYKQALASALEMQGLKVPAPDKFL